MKIKEWLSWIWSKYVRWLHKSSTLAITLVLSLNVLGITFLIYLIYSIIQRIISS